MSITIINETKSTLPKVDFDIIGNLVLGKSYDLNLIITTPSKIKLLNKIYRGKDKPTDILSFPLSKSQGEIYICTSESKKQAKQFGRSYNNFFVYLFIHGCAHLKGYDHGSRMDVFEHKICRAISLQE